ncbi:MAG: hypothetical protein ACRC0L_06845, partial [Angustibacter sp.]
KVSRSPVDEMAMIFLATCRARHSALRSSPERGDIVLGWLTKVVVSLALAGVIFFDAISVVTTRLAVEDDAAAAARAATDSWDSAKSVPQALEQARLSATESSSANVLVEGSFRIAQDGSVTLSLRRTAKTMIVRRVSAIESWGKITRSGQSKSVS